MLQETWINKVVSQGWFADTLFMPLLYTRLSLMAENIFLLLPADLEETIDPLTLLPMQLVLWLKDGPSKTCFQIRKGALACFIQQTGLCSVLLKQVYDFPSSVTWFPSSER